MKRLFISYSRKDADVLQELLSQLDAAAYATERIDYWFDKDQDDGIEGGEEWEQRLHDEIGRCDIFCLFLTANWGASKNCRNELEWAERVGKRIVQLRVRAVELPRKKVSALPNENIWIAQFTDQGSRDRYWQQVVAELQKIRVETLASAPRRDSAEFDRICEMIERLRLFKQFHDKAHGLYEEHYKGIMEEVKDGKLNDRTIGDCVSEIDDIVADLKGLKKDKEELLCQRDQEQISVLLDRLQACKPYLEQEVLPKLHTPGFQVAEVGSRMITLGSTLGRSLTFFNERMVEAAKEFDPRRFAQLLEAAVSGQNAGRDQWQRLLASIEDASTRLLAEHDSLQFVQEKLVGFEAEEFDLPRKRERFLSREWPRIAEKMTPLLAQWKAQPLELTLHKDSVQKRQQLSVRFVAVDRSFSDMNAVEPVSGDLLATAKRTYQDFVDAFDKYFYELDDALKEEYKRIDGELRQQASQFELQPA